MSARRATARCWQSGPWEPVDKVPAARLIPTKNLHLDSPLFACTLYTIPGHLISRSPRSSCNGNLQRTLWEADRDRPCQRTRSTLNRLTSLIIAINDSPGPHRPRPPDLYASTYLNSTHPTLGKSFQYPFGPPGRYPFRGLEQSSLSKLQIF